MISQQEDESMCCLEGPNAKLSTPRPWLEEYQLE
jgi:hypothetical protein